jgi:hypothetical protein
MFQRNIDSKTRNLMQGNKLFEEKLKTDINRGEVFPAIRNNRMDFYYKGGNLFSFKKEFSTHKKYASVIKSKTDYISETDLQNIGLIQDFSEGYEQIKKNCSLYSGVETKGISWIYHKYPFTNNNLEIVVLDIEISFKSSTEGRTQDRIDILLFNKKTQQLRFYEAKHYSNSEIWATENKLPKAISQVQRYEKQIEKENSTVLSQYCNYTRIVNELFGCNLPEPKSVDDKVTLLIFGFDRDQQKGRMKKLLIDDRSLTGIQYYFIGNILSLDIKNLWNEVK